MRLGWPRGSRSAREEFQTWREAAMPHGGRPPRAPTFCHSELDLYVVLTNVLCDGGYELVTAEKNWKKIAKTLGKDLTTQTSASFALRTHYQRCLLDLENWLWANVDTLGPRPDSFDDASDAKDAKDAPARAAPRGAADDAMDADGARDAVEEDGYADSDDAKSAGDDKEAGGPAEEEPEEEPEGDEAFDPDAESDEGDDAESDEDFAPETK